MAVSNNMDEDGRQRRTGTAWTAGAFITAAVMGPGLLSSSWAMSQLGWIAGAILMLLFAFVAYYTSTLLAACYLSEDPDTGERNCAYMDLVRSNLGDFWAAVGRATQFFHLSGCAIGYNISSIRSIREILRSICFRAKGVNSPCKVSTIPYYMIAFVVVELFLSQMPSFSQIWWLSTVAAIMSFIYSSIAFGLGVEKIAEDGVFRGTLTGIGVGAISRKQKIFGIFKATGFIAFAYSYSFVLIEIQDTIRSPPSEYKTMKRATLVSLTIATIFYMLCGCVGYAAFGDMSPENLLAAFGFHELYWLLDIAYAATIVHHIGAYQIFCQPIFAFVEKTASEWFPNGKFINEDIPIPGFRSYKLNLFRLVWRSIFVIITTIIAMLVPSFNDAAGVLGAIGLWRLTIYFPVTVYIVQKKIPKRSPTWICLQILNVSGMIISIAAAVGSLAGIIYDLKGKPHSKP